MKIQSLAAMAFALLAGCGPWSSGPRQCTGSYGCGNTWSGGGGLPTTQYSTFVIDAGAAIQLPQSTLGITTNGQGDWVLAWQGDRYAHQFEGSITCPAGCQIAYARFDNAYPGDSAQITAQNQIAFNGVTNAAVPQNLLFRLTAQPVTFDLYIDGQPAIGATVFASEGALSTTDSMPFSLVSSNVAFSGKTDKAPAHVPKLPEDGVERVITVAAPPVSSQSVDK